MLDYEVEKMPEKGLFYGRLKKEILYTSYCVKDGTISFAKGEVPDPDELTEGHFFDGKKEYRLIKRESRNDLLKLCFTEEEEKAMDKDLLMEETVLVKEEYVDASAGVCDHIRIINRYAYSKDDTLVLRNYRLAM